MLSLSCLVYDSFFFILIAKFFSFVTANFFFNLLVIGTELFGLQWVPFVFNFLQLVVDSSSLGFFELKLRVHWDDS